MTYIHVNDVRVVDALTSEMGISILTHVDSQDEDIFFPLEDDGLIVEPNWTAWPSNRLGDKVLVRGGLELQVDYSSAFDGRRYYEAYGTISFQNTTCSIFAKRHEGGINRGRRYVLRGAFQTVPANEHISFSRWRLAAFAGSEMIIAKSFDVGRADKPLE